MKATENSEPLLNVPVIIGPRDAPRSWSGAVLPYTPPAQRRDRVLDSSSQQNGERLDQAIAVSISLNR